MAFSVVGGLALLAGGGVAIAFGYGGCAPDEEPCDRSGVGWGAMTALTGAVMFGAGVGLAAWGYGRHLLAFPGRASVTLQPTGVRASW